jgi:inosine-uridine nucleoside N-ribohydrolase
MTTKILLDTDIGSDIDDAVALAYLLAQPECDLLGITTVTGEALKRAAMASALCKVAGKKVPIYPGAERPLLIEQKQPEAPQAAALDQWPHDTFASIGGEAVEFLRWTIRKHPGEITLLTIGPLTNIGLLFAANPDIPALLKGLVIMGGKYLGDDVYPEWNIMLDPHAAEIVYQRAPANNRSIGTDVTVQVWMTAGDVRARFAQHKLLRPVLDFAEVWFQHRGEITFHDPLAAATIFDDALCTYQRGRVTVELAEGKSQGTARWAPGDGPHEVADTVNVARFFEHYFSVFG